MAIRIYLLSHLRFDYKLGSFNVIEWCASIIRSTAAHPKSFSDFWFLVSGF